MLNGSEHLHEVRKRVSVVFCDLSGSTSLAERLDAESLRRVVSRYYEEMKAVIERHGGTAAFSGDAVMARSACPSSMRTIRCGPSARRPRWRWRSSA